MEVRKTQTILIVEDSQEDYETTVRAFRKSKLINEVIRCENGDEALEFLTHQGKFSDAVKYPTPGIILLDLNLPGTDGREVLAEIKKNPNLKKLPVIVMTTSHDEKDINACYEMGANTYVHKPVDTQGFIAAIQKLRDYWFEVAVLPGSSKP